MTATITHLSFYRQETCTGANYDNNVRRYFSLPFDAALGVVGAIAQMPDVPRERPDDDGITIPARPARPEAIPAPAAPRQCRFYLRLRLLILKALRRALFGSPPRDNLRICWLVWGGSITGSKS